MEDRFSDELRERIHAVTEELRIAELQRLKLVNWYLKEQLKAVVPPQTLVFKATAK